MPSLTAPRDIAALINDVSPTAHTPQEFALMPVASVKETNGRYAPVLSTYHALNTVIRKPRTDVAKMVHDSGLYTVDGWMDAQGLDRYSLTDSSDVWRALDRPVRAELADLPDGTSIIALQVGSIEYRVTYGLSDFIVPEHTWTKTAIFELATDAMDAHTILSSATLLCACGASAQFTEDEVIAFTRDGEEADADPLWSTGCFSCTGTQFTAH